MADRSLGKVMMIPKGAYNATSIYNKLDFVIDDGTSYVALEDNITNKKPKDNPTKWQILASGIAVASEEHTYAAQSQAQYTGEPPATGWQQTIPEAIPGGYLWTKTVITYENQQTTTNYSLVKNGQNGIATAEDVSFDPDFAYSSGTVGKELTEQSSQITSLQGDVSTQSSQIASLGSTVAGHTSQISDLTSKTGSVSLESGTDLNNIVTGGIYTCFFSYVTTTILHKPINDSTPFTLVVSGYGNQTGCTQTFLSDTGIYIRRATSSSWGDWVEYANTSALDAKSDFFSISEGANLSNCLDSGIYSSPVTLAGVGTLIDKPEGLSAPFIMLVRGAGSLTGCVQAIFTDASIYTRRATASGFARWWKFSGEQL